MTKKKNKDRGRSQPEKRKTKKSAKKTAVKRKKISGDAKPDRKVVAVSSKFKKGGRRRGTETVTGILEGHPRGFGFVRPDAEGVDDVFVPARYMEDALHGDRVQVRVHARGRDGRTWGEVTKIISQCQEPLIGRFDGMMVVPRDPRFQARVRVHPADALDAGPGDMVVARITKRNIKGVHGRVIEVLGDLADPGIESRIVLRSHGFNEAFPAQVEVEANKAPNKVRKSDLEGRQDLRDLTTVTIDPERARDFDDALSIEKNGKGYVVRVSIADVSHYVRPGSAIDAEAYERATSVYLPDRSIPMLPEELSSGICSLREGVDRLAMTVQMGFDEKGKRRSASFYPSVIKSDYRLSYEQVEAMEHDKKLREKYPRAWPSILLLRELARLRKKLRTARGSIDLDMPEAEVVLDQDGEVVTILRREQTWSHQLVEEFMLAANEVVAEFFFERHQPAIYRIHEPPAPPAVEALADMIAPLGLTILGQGSEPGRIKPRDYQRLIKKTRGTPNEMMVKVLCLRSMMQAVYSEKTVGHFGLASSCYCHFTSPIRRYPDLIVHRLLKLLIAFSGSGKMSAPKRLSESAAHCSERERAAEKSEREMVDLYSAKWMAKHLGEEFEGVVSGVKSFGIFVELVEVFVEGLVPRDTMDERLEYIEEEMVIRGKGNKEEYRIGGRVRVRAEAVDLEQRRINFSLVGKGKREGR